MPFQCERKCSDVYEQPPSTDKGARSDIEVCLSTGPWHVMAKVLYLDDDQPHPSSSIPLFLYLSPNAHQLQCFKASLACCLDYRSNRVFLKLISEKAASHNPNANLAAIRPLQHRTAKHSNDALLMPTWQHQIWRKISDSRYYAQIPSKMEIFQRSQHHREQRATTPRFFWAPRAFFALP